MRIKIFSLSYFSVLFFEVLISFILLLYLVLSDTYFRYLDFKLEQFAVKIEKYLVVTFYAPTCLTILFCIFLWLKQSDKIEKKVILLSFILAIITFTYIGKFIIKFFVFESIILSLVVPIILFLSGLIFTFRGLKNREFFLK